MIRINLLPKEQRQRRAKLNWQLYAGLLGWVLLIVGMAYYWWMLKSGVEQLKGDIAKTKDLLNQNIELVKKVDQYRGDLQNLQQRLQAIERLEVLQVGPVKLLDTLSMLLPSEIWLTSLSKTANRLVIQGYAFSNDGVANLMMGMGKAAPFFQNVELSFSEKTAFEKAQVERFEITADVSS